MHPVLTVLRYTVLGLVVLAALATFGSWLVRTRRISPFSATGRALRSATDAILNPVERRLVRMGGNPTHAGGWLIVVTAIAGIVLLSFAGWLLGTFETARMAAGRGPRSTAILLIGVIYSVLVFAILLRVIASWFGLFRYSRWIRPAYVLTDWIVEPIRRIIPPLGAMDISPLVAWFALFLLRGLLISALR